MPTFVYGTWTFGVDLAEVIEQATYLSPRLSDFTHLGSTATLQNARMANIVNRAIEEFLEAIPFVGQSSSTLTTVYGQQPYAIPASVHGLSIVRIAYSSAVINGAWALQELTYVPQPTVANFAAWLQNGTQGAQYPSQWSYDKTAANILLWPWPWLADLILDVFYQQKPTAITTANVTNRVGTPITIGEIPIRWQNVLALRIASEVVASLDQQTAADLESQYQAGIAEVQEAMTKVLAADRGTAQGYGMGGGPVNYNSLYQGNYYL